MAKKIAASAIMTMQNVSEKAQVGMAADAVVIGVDLAKEGSDQAVVVNVNVEEPEYIPQDGTLLDIPAGEKVVGPLTVFARYSQDIVAEFHKVFGHPLRTIPHVPSVEHRLLRVRLIAEELGEFARASGVSLRLVAHPTGTDVVEVTDVSGRYKPNVVEAADALGDLDYVVAGSHLAWGTPGYSILKEVHASNMSKAGADGRPIYDAGGKVLKGPSYFRPDILRVLREAGYAG